MSNPDQSLPLAITSAPGRIWLDLGFNPREEDAHFSNLHEVTWSKNNATGDGIEYVRVDLAATEAAAMAATVPHEKLTHEIDMVLTDPDTKLSPGAVRALQWCRTWVSVPLQLAQAPVAGQPAEPSPAVTHLLWLALEHPISRYLMSNAEGRWNGAEKAHCHEELCRYYVAAYRGTSTDRARRDGLNDTYNAVHRATQALTDHMDEVIGFPLEGRPDYDTLAPKFFAEFHRLAVGAIAPKGDSNG